MNIDPIIERLSTFNKGQRNGIYAGVMLLIIVLYVVVFLLPTIDNINSSKNKISENQSKLDDVKTTVQGLTSLKKQSEDLQLQLEKARKALPESNEIPELLKKISEHGSKVGLEISKFNQEPERFSETNEFVAETPIELAVIGNYHDIAIFFDRISQMDRIVHVDNIDIAIETEDSNKVRLLLEGSAITFRFLSDEERESRAKLNKNKKGKRRR